MITSGSLEFFFLFKFTVLNFLIGFSFYKKKNKKLLVFLLT
jgi:hypothetical protein